MLIQKTNPVGIDKMIDRIQERLYNRLGWSNYESYHRVYVNETENGLVPEKFESGKDYKEVFFDDKYDATSYFVVTSPVSIDEKAAYPVSIYFQCKLDALYPTVTHRADEEAHYDVLRVLSNNFKRIEITSQITGIGNVYSGWRQDQIQFTDMHPFHVFRIDMIINMELPCN